ncbi:MAG TPA: RdgB/HAM1 family non-canonical purine NTP pyrophosphatase [Candidatus Dormibacteraeota bacterium]|nr:RdgB/HAM1 family non-canonical purine NTP pyrophosphatase [Candidatus Dormibacteraeota bacterium]
MAERRLVIATGNAGKLGEYRSLLAGTELRLVPADPGVAEVGSTYAENAQLKAEAAREALGLPAVGDDSGVEVEVLKGFPGIHSARIGPTQKERTQVLLDRLAGHPRPWLARFVCTIGLAVPGRQTEFFEGECRGEIIPEWRGEAGFGYDPVFLVPEAGRTFGEMSSEEKALYSHRARAVLAMLASGALERLY